MRWHARRIHAELPCGARLLSALISVVHRRFGRAQNWMSVVSQLNIVHWGVHVGQRTPHMKRNAAATFADPNMVGAVFRELDVG